MEKITKLQCKQNSSWLSTFYKKSVMRAFSCIKVGRVILQDGVEQRCFGEAKTHLTATITVNDSAMYKAFTLNGSVGAGESYILGHWSCEKLTQLIEIVALNQRYIDEFEQKYAFITRLKYRFNHFRNRNSQSGSKKNIVAHYDLGNELYESFLSPEMLYSCAVYETPESTLAQAQQYKLQRICEQVDLQPGDSVIEIGTGWGAFAIYAASHYACHVTTTTISEQQHDYVAEKIKRLGLSHRITLLKLDYRELTGKFDKLVSIEMIEAVGHEYLPGFFKQCSDLLKDEGAMLLQAITIADQRYSHYLKHSDFIQQYIFPGGCLPSLTQMCQQIQQQTNMVVHSVNDIGAHYAKTLADWRKQFISNWPTLDHTQYDQRFYRLWLYYFAYCEGAFRAKATSTVHLVARKPRFYTRQDETLLDY